MSNSAPDYVSLFRASLPYINAHRGRTFVLMISGEALAHENLPHIIHDIALLNTLGVKLVIVHGSRPQIEQRLAERQVHSQFHDGLRITDPPALACVTEAAGALRAGLEALLSMGLANSPMHRARIRATGGNFVIARPLGVVDGIDYQHTGEIRRIDGDSVQSQLELGNIVLVSPLGYSPTGEIFNLGMEEVATRMATVLGAEKLIAFGQGAGLVNPSGELLRELSLSEAGHLQTEQEHTRLLQALLTSGAMGVERCHLISYQDNGALLKELFTRDGCGSLIYRDSYESIRTAAIDDVGGILELIDPLEREGVLVKRSRELLENEISRFTVIERDGMIIGCAALYPFTRERLGELACVATHPDYRGGKRGERLLERLEKNAREQQLESLFVLTTRTAHWFLEQGFTEGAQDDLPDLKRALYNYRRNSRIFFKAL